MAKTLIVDETSRGKRADIAASEVLPSLNRAYVHHLIDDERILMNDKPVKPGYRLRMGDKLKINFDESEIDHIPDIDLPVIYEDSDVLVIDKPVGVISHARSKFWNEPSVASFVRQKTGQEGERTGIVHRLDRATSGVMICAKNSRALSHLQKQFSTRKVKKSYIAIVEGNLEPREAIIEAAIERNPNHPQTFRAGTKGRSAVTHYTVVKQFGNFSEVLLQPETGRTHQLRVHMSFIKHPIVGDTLYGAKEADRLYLHALELEITLPGGNRRKFKVEKPEEFTKLGV